MEVGLSVSINRGVSELLRHPVENAPYRFSGIRYQYIAGCGIVHGPVSLALRNKASDTRGILYSWQRLVEVSGPRIFVDPMLWKHSGCTNFIGPRRIDLPRDYSEGIQIESFHGATCIERLDPAVTSC